MKDLNIKKPCLNQNDLNIIIEFCSHVDNLEQNFSAKIELEIKSLNKTTKAIILQDNKFHGYIQKKNNQLFFVEKNGSINFILSNADYDRTNRIVKKIIHTFTWNDFKPESKKESSNELMNLVFS